MSSQPPFPGEETQVTLLLCAPLLAAKQKGAALLSPGEFNRVTTELQKHGAALGDLLASNAASLIANLPPTMDPSRIEALLGRGFLLSLALEKWSGMGLWVLSRNENRYPKRLKDRLGQLAPPLLYGCGEIELLEQGGIAVVGSRDVDEAGTAFTRTLAARCALENIVVVSGGAKGVDQTAMRTAAEEGGRVVGILGADLGRAALSGQARDLIRESRVTLVSPFDPEAGFNVGNAMARNKVIYAAADYAVVVSSGEKEGGTWAGAIEQLEKFKQIPVFVRTGENAPGGNDALVKIGGIPLPEIPDRGLNQYVAKLAGNVTREPVEMLLTL